MFCAAFCFLFLFVAFCFPSVFRCFIVYVASRLCFLFLVCLRFPVLQLFFYTAVADVVCVVSPSGLCCLLFCFLVFYVFDLTLLLLLMCCGLPSVLCCLPILSLRLLISAVLPPAFADVLHLFCVCVACCLVFLGQC